MRQLAPDIEAAFGAARLLFIFVLAGAAGFLLSDVSGVLLTIGASGSIFGRLGAMVQYGRSCGGVFGMAVFRQYGQWALVLFVLAFLMPGINNVAHAGGFAAGYVVAWLAGPGERAAGHGVHRLLALALLAVTALGFALSIWML